MFILLLQVSNHGARQLDTTPATIEVLREIVTAVRGYSGSRGRGNSHSNNSGGGRGRDTEVYLDGGIMRGTDVLKVHHIYVSSIGLVFDVYLTGCLG